MTYLSVLALSVWDTTPLLHDIRYLSALAVSVWGTTALLHDISVSSGSVCLRHHTTVAWHICQLWHCLSETPLFHDITDSSGTVSNSADTGAVLSETRWIDIRPTWSLRILSKRWDPAVPKAQRWCQIRSISNIPGAVSAVCFFLREFEAEFGNNKGMTAASRGGQVLKNRDIQKSRISVLQW
jgi:hypothetical protein